MNCWHCERPAHGVCVFCGRGICKEHVQTMPNILALYRDKLEILKAVVVADALCCGVCKPKENPVNVEWLDESV